MIEGGCGKEANRPPYGTREFAADVNGVSLPQNKIIGCELPEHGLIHNSFGVAFVNSRRCVNSNVIRLVAVTGHREEIV